MKKICCWRSEKGAVGVIVAVVIVILLSVMAPVIDIGQAYQLKRELQTSTDAAALAAAYDLARGDSQAIALSTAEDYAQKNARGTYDSLDVTFPTSNTVRVEARQSQATFFAKLFGISTVQVAAASTAGGDLATTVNSGVVPIIVPYQSITDHVGSENATTFNLAGETNSPQQGFFWLVNFSSQGAGTPEYEEWIKNGYPYPVTVGNTANGEGMKAALKEALEVRMAENPKLILPLYDYTEATGGSKTYHIVGFAEFVITGFDLTGSPKTITGYFTTGDVVDGVSGGEQTPRDYGIVVVRLTQ